VLGAFLLRLVLVPLGYIAAVLASVLLIVAIEMIRAYPPVAGDASLVLATAAVVGFDALVLFWLIGTVGLLPAAAAIAIAEALSLRSWIYYAAAGAAIAALLAHLLVDVHPALPHSVSGVAAAGLAGGLAYWLVAGRSAGRNRPSPPPPPLP
jgi:hypothetical protein